MRACFNAMHHLDELVGLHQIEACETQRPMLTYKFCSELFETESLTNVLKTTPES